MVLNPLPIDIWSEILLLLDIKEAIALSKAYPRFIGAFIEAKQAIRFRNAINSYMHSAAVDLPVGPLASFICYLLRRSSLELSSLLSWIARRYRPVLTSSIVVNRKLFEDLSRTIALKDRGFVSVSSSLSNWTFEMRAENEIVCSLSWILLYRASISGYRAADFHRACDGTGKCAFVGKGENGRVSAAYNEDGFTSVYESTSPNLNGFIASINEEGGCGELYHRNGSAMAIWNHSGAGPVFDGIDSIGPDFHISSNCD
jgi:hypothetical protein